MTHILQTSASDGSQTHTYAHRVRQNSLSGYQQGNPTQNTAQLNSSFLNEQLLPPIKKSLNRGARKRELTKITTENQRMLRRLQERKSNYSVDNWIRDDENRRSRLSKMCEYPYRLDERTNRTQMGFIKSGGYNYPLNASYGQTKKDEASRSVTKAKTSPKRQAKMSPQQTRKILLHAGEAELGTGFPHAVEIFITKKE